MDDASTRQATNEEHRSPAGQLLVPRRLAPRAANAASHGLTAKRYLPEILGPELLERHRQRFRSEWQPSSPTQVYLVEELARHAAALERATPIEEAVLRTAARGLSGITNADGNDTAHDLVLAAACGTESVDRVTRYRRAHEKGFLSALARLRELRVVSDAVLAPAATPPLHFNEMRCLRFLQHHRDAEKLRCRSCGGAEGTWVVGRELWQCRECRRQVSARSGTVLARSQLPLRTWFAAIAAILRNRDISTDGLSDVTGIRRAKTDRALARRVRQAIDSPQAGRLLAGLNVETLRTLAPSCR